jgi:hypothetical protein
MPPRLLTRLERRMEALQRVKLDGFQMVISGHIQCIVDNVGQATRGSLMSR